LQWEWAGKGGTLSMVGDDSEETVSFSMRNSVLVYDNSYHQSELGAV